MTTFTNETIDTSQLPRFEEVQFTPLHPDYWKVTLIALGIFFVVVTVGLGLMMVFIDEWQGYELHIGLPVLMLMVLVFVFSRIAFNRKGYAFRTHDVLFRSGIIATNTIVIPYNRVQHVALHEGLLSRWFGLAEVQIFTAGGSGSDIEIPGIEKTHAENIKQLLMGKIRKEL